MKRKLTVILSADVVGYSGMMERDEAGTLSRLKENRRVLFDPKVEEHGGRIFKLMGDGVLAEFPSAVAAVTFATEIQQAMRAAASADGHPDPITYRMGINIGEVIVDGEDIYGDGVNVAARIQTIAPTGGVAVARNVSDQVAGKIAVTFEDLGDHALKNIARPVQVFVVRDGRPEAARSPVKATKPVKEKKIAVCVLPFANMSGESEQEYFSDGISEDIITDLSRVSALSVISRNSAFSYKGKHVDLPKIARELNVSHVLEGSVRKAGQRVRITAQLIDGATNEHIWAERFDRDLQDIFAVQDEISEAIVKALKVRLLPEERAAIERRGTASVEAWSLVAEARQFLLRENPSARIYRAVVRFCENAIAIDPDFAEAWATIASAKDGLRFNDGIYEEDGFDAAMRALALDDKLSIAYSTAAMGHMRRDRFAEAEAMIAKAMELEPDRPEVLKARAGISYRSRNFAEALAYFERAAAASVHDISSPGMMHSCAMALGDAAALERSAQLILNRADPILAREPDNTYAIGWLVTILAYQGQAERAKHWIKRALIFDPESFVSVYNFACALTQLGEHDEAVELLRSVKSKFTDENLKGVRADPDFDALKDHAGFIDLLAEVETLVAEARR